MSDQEGELEFYDWFNCRYMHSGKSSLINNSNKRCSKVIRVKSMRLDSYLLDKIKKPTIIKVDVEGAEYLFLKGAQNFLRESNPIMIMEIYPGELYRKAVDFLRKFGFSMFKIDEYGEIETLNDYHIEGVLSGKINLGDNFIFRRV